MKRVWFVFLYYVSWVAFVGVSLVLNLCCWPWLWWGNDTTHPKRARSVVRFLFDMWVRWFHASGVLRITWVNFPKRLPAGVVYVANHPTLVDATLLMSRLEDATTICKPALMRSPAVGPAARLCGYLSGDSMLDVVRDAGRVVGEGRSILIFPEGTRTEPGTVLGPLKPGFALVALTAKAPVHVLTLESSEGLVTRGRCWWKPPAELPARLKINLGPRWEYHEGANARELTTWVENTLRGGLGVTS